MNIEKNKFDDLDYRIELLYDIYYNQRSSECYKISSIIQKDITINTIKMPVFFDPTNIFEDSRFDLIKKQIEEEKEKYKYFFKRNKTSSYTTIFEIERYNSENMKNKNNYNKIEQLHNVLIHYVLSEYVITNGNNNIILPIMCFDCKKTIFDKQMQEVIFGNDSDYYSVFIYECYNEEKPLRNFLKKTELSIDDWRGIIIQVLATCQDLKDKYGNSFFHNNLSIDALYISKNKSNSKYNYIINKKLISFNCQYNVKMSKFYKTKLGNYMNEKIDNTENNINKDIYNLFKSIIYVLKSEDNINSSDDTKIVLQNIENIINTKKDQLTIVPPHDVIMDNAFFADFINYNSDKNHNNSKKIISRQFGGNTNKLSNIYNMSKGETKIFGSRKLVKLFNHYGGDDTSSESKPSTESSESEPSTESSETEPSTKSSKPSTESSESLSSTESLESEPNGSNLHDKEISSDSVKTPDLDSSRDESGSDSGGENDLKKRIDKITGNKKHVIPQMHQQEINPQMLRQMPQQMPGGYNFPVSGLEHQNPQPPENIGGNSFGLPQMQNFMQGGGQNSKANSFGLPEMQNFMGGGGSVKNKYKFAYSNNNIQSSNKKDDFFF